LHQSLYELVLETMEKEEFDKPAACQTNLRDRFILVALREFGLRASKLVGSKMGAFQQIPDTKTKRHYCNAVQLRSFFSTRTV